MDVPLQLDSNNPKVLEKSLRLYNGKPIVNSVNGEDAVLESILPLVKKYGAAVVGLTLDETGIPETAEGRFSVAQKIVERALSYGIPREDIYIDCLTLTASVQPEGVRGNPESHGACKKEPPCQNGIGCFQYFLWPALQRINKRFVPDSGNGPRPGSSHPESKRQSHDECYRCFQCTIWAGSSLRQIYRAACC